jgi:hypothetical protein
MSTATVGSSPMLRAVVCSGQRQHLDRLGVVVLWE